VGSLYLIPSFPENATLPPSQHPWDFFNPSAVFLLPLWNDPPNGSFAMITPYLPFFLDHQTAFTALPPILPLFSLERPNPLSFSPPVFPLTTTHRMSLWSVYLGRYPSQHPRFFPFRLLSPFLGIVKVFKSSRVQQELLLLSHVFKVFFNKNDTP